MADMFSIENWALNKFAFHKQLRKTFRNRCKMSLNMTKIANLRFAENLPLQVLSCLGSFYAQFWTFFEVPYEMQSCSASNCPQKSCQKYGIGCSTKIWPISRMSFLIPHGEGGALLILAK